jgi:hypothetical protein
MNGAPTSRGATILMSIIVALAGLGVVALVLGLVWVLVW